MKEWVGTKSYKHNWAIIHKQNRNKGTSPLLYASDTDFLVAIRKLKTGSGWKARDQQKGEFDKIMRHY